LILRNIADNILLKMKYKKIKKWRFTKKR
jgi:hypothetical protein